MISIKFWPKMHFVNVKHTTSSATTTTTNNRTTELNAVTSRQQGHEQREQQQRPKLLLQSATHSKMLHNNENNNCNKQNNYSNRKTKSNNNANYFQRKGRILNLCKAIIVCLHLASGLALTSGVPTDSWRVEPATEQQTWLRRVARDVHRPSIQEQPQALGMSTVAHLVPDEEVSKQQQEAAAATGATTTIAVPAEAPSSVPQEEDQCLLDGLSVPKATVYCEKQIGCRAIQKTGHCCPDYKCDCEKDGKTYANGDKLVDPETPCQFCYCKGGEIFCNEIQCYHQENCPPKFIPGVCCPQYDNCPVSGNATLNSAPDSSSTTPTTTAAPEPSANHSNNDNNNDGMNHKITIKEITKPIEIRITDDNKAVIHPMAPKSSTTSTTAAPVPTAILNITPKTITPTFSPTFSSWGTNESSTASPTSVLSQDKNPTINRNESLKLSASVAYPLTQRPPLTLMPVVVVPFLPQPPHGFLPSAVSTTVLDGEGSAEIEDEFFSTPTNATGANSKDEDHLIAIFVHQGLPEVDKNAASDPSKVNIKREYTASTEGASAPEEFAFAESQNPSTQLNSPSNGQIGYSSPPTGETEPDTAGSDNIYRIILTTDGPRLLSTEVVSAINPSTQGVGVDPAIEAPNDLSPENEKLLGGWTFYGPSSTEGPSEDKSSSPSLEMSNSTPAIEVPTTEGPQSESISTQSPGSSSSSPSPHTEEEAPMPAEANPAYPSLPEDDFSLRDVNFPLTEVEDEIKEEPRVLTPALDALKSTKQLDESSGDGSGDMELLSTTEAADYILSSGSRALVQKPMKIAIMNSGENLSAETKISNNTDFGNKDPNISQESLEGDSMESLIASMDSGSGNGSGELVSLSSTAKQREPTTPRPRPKSQSDLDIDELGDGSGDGSDKSSPAEDPKLDVESLKVNEDEDSSGTVAKPESGSNADDVLSIKTNPAQDKTAEEVPVARVQRLILHRVY